MKLLKTLERLAYLGALVIVSVSIVAEARAGQSTSTEATLSGQVTDESKSVMPGVGVTATSPVLQVPNVTTVTDERGEYRLTPLPIGTYTIEYSLSGFQTVRREGIRLTAGFTARVDIVLNVGALEETVTVSGAAPVVDVTSTSAVTTMTREMLDTIPTGRQGFIGLMQLAPGTRPTLDVGGSSQSQHSFRAFGMQGEPWPSVDGVVTKNPRLSESGNYFDYTMIEEASVAALGHDASVANRGVVINSVVKSGSNAFHGALFYGGTNSHLESSPEGGDLVGGNLELRDDFSAELGGRIVRDKLWFWVGVRNQRNEESVLGCFKPDGEICEHKRLAQFLTPKVTYQMTSSQRITGFATMNKRDQVTGLSPLVAWSARRQYQPNSWNGATKIEWQAVKGNSLVMNALLGDFWNHSGTICIDETCDMIARRDRNTGQLWGLSVRAGEKNRESRQQIRTGLSWYRPNWAGGNHEIKVGLDYFHAPAERKQLGRGPARDYRLNYRGTSADRIEIWNYPVDPDNAIDTVALYLADSWTIGRKLTLNLGVRYAREDAHENPGCRDAAPAPADVAFPAKCWDKLQMPIFNSFVPRARAAYDLMGDGRTVIKGGWGRYMSPRLFDHMQSVLNAIAGTVTYRWRDLNGNSDYDTDEVNLALNGPDFLSLSLAGQFEGLGNGIINPDESQPYTDEYSLQVERQLASELAVRVTALSMRVLNSYRLANPLRPYSSYSVPITNLDPGPDGVARTADDPGTSITYFEYPQALAGAAYQQGMIVNDDKANQTYNSFEIAVSKRLTNNWQFQASHSATKRNVPLEPNSDEVFNTQDPNSEIFAESHAWEWGTRLSGSYLFQYGILASALFEHRSGDPWARTVLLSGGQQIPDLTARAEAIGAQRLPHVNLLSFRAEKRFGLPKAQELQLRTNLYNVFNTNVATTISSLSGPSFGVVTARVLPRVIDFQANYTF